MTKQEIASLKAIVENLRNSTKVSWTNGGMDEWVPWAKSMRAEIRSSSKIIEAMLDSTELDTSIPKKEDEPLTLD